VWDPEFNLNNCNKTKQTKPQPINKIYTHKRRGEETQTHTCREPHGKLEAKTGTI
jgi:hypothetical protein